MENLDIILSAAGTALGLLVTALTFLTKFIKSAKARKAAQDVIKIAGAVIPFIEQAETFTHYTGAEKKEYVMTKANRFAIENGIPFEEQTIGDKVEELVELSRQVNNRCRDAAADGLKI